MTYAPIAPDMALLNDTMTKLRDLVGRAAELNEHIMVTATTATELVAAFGGGEANAGETFFRGLAPGEALRVADFEDRVEAADAAETAADNAAFDAGEASIEAGARTFPASVAEAIMSGENKVRVYRRHRGLKQADLAAAVGCSAAYISQIEIGAVSLSLKMARKIAEALGLNLISLID